MSDDTHTTTAKHFNHVRSLWFSAFSEIRLYLMHLDGDTSRKIGCYIQNILDTKTNDSDWPTVGAATFIRDDPDLWHEIADSRKK